VALAVTPAKSATGEPQGALPQDHSAHPLNPTKVLFIYFIFCPSQTERLHARACLLQFVVRLPEIAVSCDVECCGRDPSSRNLEGGESGVEDFEKVAWNVGSEI
jgi:hypothetical protein